jgi:hypothetical protein
VWDDGLVIYDSRTDEVHCFDNVTGGIFEELRAGPQLLSDLVIAMSRRMEVVADQELEGLVNEILRILVDKNIAARVG